MQAAVLKAFGSPLAIETVPDPVLGTGEVIVDVVATREALETLGIPVVGYQTDSFPAFYLRESEARVDVRFDDIADLAAFVAAELPRSGRGIVIAHPIPAADAIAPDDWKRWFSESQKRSSTARGRDATPMILKHLHEVSNGATLRANLALVRANARLAARLCAASSPR